MNFEESNEFVEKMEKNDKNKKKILSIMIFLAILVAILTGVILFLGYQDSLVLKMYIDEKQVPISTTLLVEQDGKDYINVRELATMLGYSYQNGEYKSYTEESNSCYIKNEYEVVSMSANADTVTKYIMQPIEEMPDNENSDQKTEGIQLITTDEKTGEQQINIVVDSENETPEIFKVDEPVKYINNQLYVPFSEMSKIFNVRLNLANENRIRIYSLKNMILSAQQIAANLNYSVVSNTYENLTAMIDNMIVVGDGANYGVVSLQTGQPVISLKYEKVVYMQNTREFLVFVEDTVGIVSAEGKTIIKPIEYDDISKLDEINKLYLVEKDNKYGVLNGEGETIVYAEYDFVGIENKEEFKNENIRNFNVLFDECIPVTQNGKMGLIDIEGEKRLQCTYDAFGYVDSEFIETKTEQEEGEENEESELQETQTLVNKRPVEGDNVLTIPEEVGIKGIVVKLNGSYGIYDVEAGRLIIPCVYSRIFSRTKSGITTYYLEYNEEEIELKEYLESNDLISVKSEQTQEVDVENNEQDIEANEQIPEQQNQEEIQQDDGEVLE